tara:strand:+ start:497 stop:1105 length:609 start_codon:yes stop_codon:yes gene_type:complete
MSDLNKLYLDIHNKMKSEHGFSSKALWGSENSQRIRFEILTKCMSPTQSTIKILDVGSGLGHLYGYLLEKGFEIDYTGLEINKEFVEQSKKTYPHAKFILGDINQLEELDEVYDYAFASGIYNLGIKKETQDVFVHDFKSIIKRTKQACGVNFLSSASKNQDDISVYHEPSEIINLVEDKLSSNCEIFENYLPNDFTVIIYK